MRVKLSILSKIEGIDSYNITFNRNEPAVAAIFSIFDRKILKTYNVTKEYINNLIQRGVVEVSINTNRTIMELLKKIAPEIFITPTGEKKLGELFMLADEYETMNLKSHKNRFLKILEDVYSTELNIRTGESDMLIEYGTVLNSKVISRVKKYIDPLQKVYYKDSEEGVLVFVPNVKDFKLKVDLFAILAGFDFPIYDAKNVYDAISIYKEKSPKLVVFGNLAGSLEAKKALLEIEEYDPYVKKLNYDESPSSNRRFEADRIKNNYETGYAKFLAIEKSDKESLPEEIKEIILKRIGLLQQKWSDEEYIETAYALKQFGRTFNITALWNMLQNLKKRSIKNF